MGLKQEIDQFLKTKKKLYQKYKLNELYEFNDLYYLFTWVTVNKGDKILLFTWDSDEIDFTSDEALKCDWTDGVQGIHRIEDVVLIEHYDVYSDSYSMYIMEKEAEVPRKKFSDEIWQELSEWNGG